MDSKYHNMVIQKSLKQEFKIKSFYMFDLAIIMGPTMFLLYIQSFAQFKMLTLVLLAIISIFLGLFLCAKPASNGGQRNIYTIFCLITMDRCTYETQSYTSKLKEK